MKVGTWAGKRLGGQVVTATKHSNTEPVVVRDGPSGSRSAGRSVGMCAYRHIWKTFIYAHKVRSMKGYCYKIPFHSKLYNTLQVAL